MNKFSLNDNVSFSELFALADDWANMPANSLSQEQLAILQLKSSVLNKQTELKAGGGGPNSFCFICITGA